MKELRDYYDRLYGYTDGLSVRRVEETHRVKVFLSRDIAQAFKTFLKGETARAVLDAGCGRGDNLATLWEIGRPALLAGFDFSPQIVSFARRRFRERSAPRPLLLVCDVQFLCFRDAVFDVALGTELLEHVPDDRRGLREIRRVLKPNGLFLGSVPGHQPGRAMEETPVDSMVGRESWDGMQDGHFRRYSFEGLRDRLAEAGLPLNAHYTRGKYFYRLSQKLNRRILDAARSILGLSASPGDPYLTAYLSSLSSSPRHDLLTRIYSFLFLPVFNLICDLDLVFQRRATGTGLFFKARRAEFRHPPSAIRDPQS
jgi:ubiquinone/menaquinone biosynthesis C-methylase UbiE